MDEPAKVSTGSGCWRSIPLFVVSGIPVRLHITFIFFLLWVAYIAQQNALASVGFVIALFTFVLLHELGHALVARRYGIGTRDITLYPIGGIATIQDRPKPAAELWIALAGPAVNFVCAGLLFAAQYLVNPHHLTLSLDLGRDSVVGSLVVANLTLGLFNLIPAFPMDGGRVLRAILALNMPEDNATRIAGSVGQLLGVAMLMVGLFTGEVVLMFVALFVMLAAGQEISEASHHQQFSGHKVSETLVTHFETLTSGMTLDEAAQHLLSGTQHDFPVMVGDDVVGILRKDDITRGIIRNGGSEYVAGSMLREFKTIGPDDPLDKAIIIFQEGYRGPILVMNEARLVGLVTMENIGEFLMLQNAKARSAKG